MSVHTFIYFSKLKTETYYNQSIKQRLHHEQLTHHQNWDDRPHQCADFRQQTYFSFARASLRFAPIVPMLDMGICKYQIRAHKLVKMAISPTKRVLFVRNKKGPGFFSERNVESNKELRYDKTLEMVADIGKQTSINDEKKYGYQWDLLKTMSNMWKKSLGQWPVYIAAYAYIMSEHRGLKLLQSRFLMISQGLCNSGGAMRGATWHSGGRWCSSFIPLEPIGVQRSLQFARKWVPKPNSRMKWVSSNSGWFQLQMLSFTF